MSHRLEVLIPGDPMPNERARRGDNGKWYTPKETEVYRKTVQQCWMSQGRIQLGAGSLHVTRALFVITRPKTHMGTGRNAQVVKESYRNKLPGGDVDNYLKGVLDALKDLAWTDDKQVMKVDGLEKDWLVPGKVYRMGRHSGMGAFTWLVVNTIPNGHVPDTGRTTPQT